AFPAGGPGRPPGSSPHDACRPRLAEVVALGGPLSELIGRALGLGKPHAGAHAKADTHPDAQPHHPAHAYAAALDPAQPKPGAEPQPPAQPAALDPAQPAGLDPPRALRRLSGRRRAGAILPGRRPRDAAGPRAQAPG